MVNFNQKKSGEDPIFCVKTVFYTIPVFVQLIYSFSVKTLTKVVYVLIRKEKKK